MAEIEKKPKTNGIAVRTLSDVVSVASLLAMFLACVWWGLKLESELNETREHVATLRQQVGNGILPRAEERLNAFQRRLERLERDQSELTARIERHIENGKHSSK